MNRNEEYKALLCELESLPESLENTVDKALTRNKALQKKRRLFRRLTTSAAACFATFVLLVNLFPTFAYACGGVPLLRELAKAVAWSPSLSAAVENEYVQPMGLTQTQNGITATVEYLIVDQKQVNIFYTLEGDYEDLSGRRVEFSPDQHCAFSYGGSPNAPGDIQTITLDYVDSDVPEGFSVTIGVASMDEELNAPPEESLAEDELLRPSEGEEPEILAEFTFALKFDPTYTAVGEIIPVNRTIALAGQTVTVTEAQVYPTHVRINVSDDPDNEAWLKGLTFYLENEDGERFEPISNGITATGGDGTDSYVSYRLESPYFARSRHLTLHITGSEWLAKDRESVHLRLEERQADFLPEGVEFKSAEHYADGWILEFRVKERREDFTHQVFFMTFEDGGGTEYEMGSQSRFTDYDSGDYTYFVERLPLPDYHEPEVWLRPTYTYTAAEETPITIPIK